MKLSVYNPHSGNEVEHLFTTTFSASEGTAEGAIIGNLVHDLLTTTVDSELYGFVATVDTKIIGAIFFSRLRFDKPLKAMLLSPVAIHPDNQRQGIGQQLLKFGLNNLQEQGVELVFSYGDPNYYCKVGFAPVDEAVVKAPQPLTYPEGWIGLSLQDQRIAAISGSSYCVDALNKVQYW